MSMHELMVALTIQIIIASCCKIGSFMTQKIKSIGIQNVIRILMISISDILIIFIFGGVLYSFFSSTAPMTRADVLWIVLFGFATLILSIGLWIDLQKVLALTRRRPD